MPGSAPLQVDATSADAVAALVREHGITHVMNAVDPRFVMPIFNGAYAGGADYLDMAMSLSVRHPDKPYEQTGGETRRRAVRGAQDGSRRAGWHWSVSASNPVCRMSSPGTPPIICSAKSRNSEHATAPTSPWTATSSRRPSRSGPPSRNASNPPVIWEADRGWFVTEPFSEPEVFRLPGGYRTGGVRQTSNTKRCC